jgi:hypothetical protein
MAKFHQITFFKEILNSYGKRFDVPIYVTRVDGAVSSQQATMEAVQRFQMDKNLTDWNTLANRFEVTVLTDPRPS